MKRFFSVFLAFLACFFAARSAAAELQPVDLVIAGPAERVELVEKAVQDPLSRLPIEVRLSRSDRVDPKAVIDGRDRAAPAFARVWVDLSADRYATLYFVDAAWERILVRRYTIERNLDDVEREEIAQIVRSAVEALLGGATIGISREEARKELLPPEPKPKLEPPAEHDVAAKAAPAQLPPPKPPIAAELGAFYEAQLYDDRLWHGPGIVAGAATADPLSLGGRLTLQYRTPMLIEGERFGARLQALALRGLARTSYARSGFLLSAGAGAGVDLTHVDPTRVSGNVETEPASWDVVPVARVIGSAGLSLSRIRASMLIGADFDIVETRNVAERDGQKYTVFETPRLRPVFGLELTVAIEATE